MASTRLLRNPSPKGRWARTHCKKLYIRFGISLVGRLEMEACRYLWFLWGRGYSPGLLQVGVSALHALEDMGWITQMVTKKVWQCNKQPKHQDTTRPHAGLEELCLFAQVCTSRNQWKVCAMAAISFTKRHRYEGEVRAPRP